MHLHVDLHRSGSLRETSEIDVQICFLERTPYSSTVHGTDGEIWIALAVHVRKSKLSEVGKPYMGRKAARSPDFERMQQAAAVHGDDDAAREFKYLAC